MAITAASICPGSGEIIARKVIHCMRVTNSVRRLVISSSRFRDRAVDTEHVAHDSGSNFTDVVRIGSPGRRWLERLNADGAEPIGGQLDEAMSCSVPVAGDTE